MEFADLSFCHSYPIGLWLGEVNGERGIFDSKCTVACSEAGEPLHPINEADWVEEEAETPEERKARLERERQEKVQKLMKMMQVRTLVVLFFSLCCPSYF